MTKTNLKELLGERFYEELQLTKVYNKASSGAYMPPLYEWLKKVNPDYNWDWPFQRYVIDMLQKFTEGEIKKLMIFAPPRTGKSELVSVHFPAYLLERNQKHRVIIGTYNQTLANKLSRKVRAISRTRIELDPDRKAMEEWDTKDGGGCRAVGVGAGVTGVGANYILIDDAIRSRKDASSITIRNATYDWYTDDIYTRLEPHGGICIMNCLAKGSKILLEDGTWKNIEDITPGENVITLNNETHIFEPKRVLDQRLSGYDKTYTLKTGQHTVVANGDHPFLTISGEYKRVKDLTVNDYLVTVKDIDTNKYTSRISKIRSIEENFVLPVYDLQVQDNENFIVEGVVCHNTRWHEDDLPGRILTNESDWTVVSLPALAEENDPLGRNPGEALNPERYNREQLLEIKAVMGRSFYALYQQRPQEQEGEYFKASWFNYIVALPELEEGQRYEFVRFWDKAATLDGDYTVGTLIAKNRSTGYYYVVDVVRGQWLPHTRDTMILRTAQKDHEFYGSVKIFHEEEPGSSGKDAARQTNTLLSGYSVKAIRATGNKQLRAEPYQSQCEAGNIYLLKGDWNSDFIDEHATFPNGSHDDIVDSCSGAFNQLSKGKGFISIGQRFR